MRDGCVRDKVHLIYALSPAVIHQSQAKGLQKEIALVFRSSYIAGLDSLSLSYIPLRSSSCGLGYSRRVPATGSTSAKSQANHDWPCYVFASDIRCSGAYA